jgi:thiamine pyrophosphokinase
MSEFLIVGAAPARDTGGFYQALVRGAAHVIAADAAGEWCVSLGRVPDLTVGDFDSSTPGAQERLVAGGSEVVSLPREKDESDLEACARAARTRGAGRLTFAAAFEGRMDHSLAALGTVLRCADLGATIEEPAWRAEVVTAASGPHAVHLGEGALFTVVSAEGAAGVSISGARYPLEDARLDSLSSLGLSNIAVTPVVTITVSAGMVLVIVQR